MAALTGAPAEAGEDDLAARIDGKLGPDVMLMGFDARGVAVAVRRAVTDGSPRERL